MKLTGFSDVTLQRARVERNTAHLHRAAVDVLSESGWNALSTRVLCARGGLTSGALYARYESTEQLLEALWDAELQGALFEPLDQAIRAVEEDGRSLFVASLNEMARPSVPRRAALELAQAAMVEPDLQPFFVQRLQSLMADRVDISMTTSPVDATVAAAVLFLGLGLCLMSRRGWATTLDLEGEFERYFEALRRPASPEPTPQDEFAEYLYSYPFDTGEERLDRVLQATAMTIGEVGYRRATMQRIARAAGVSTGYIMSRFSTKLDLFLAITEQMWGRGFTQISAYLAETGERMGQATAEAIAWREMQNPVIAKVALLTLETNRQAGFLSAIHEVIDDQERSFFLTTPSTAPSAFGLSEMALGMGLVFVAWFIPSVRDLPYVAVTTPLVESAPSL